MSLGGPDDNPELKAMIKEAIDKQIAVVVAAGNEGDSKEDRRVFVSGAYKEVIEVPAADLTGKIANFSYNNTEVDMIAPGVCV
ncbi:S8 family serine peptidase [Bacillus sp. ISL-75]|uniref:S8 family serine peptidase n=1 Tax=Bacillus sp. ISL-75 TaxID=2819137 RepID=UPI001BEB1160|nr:S8 family serine peptidase [Bacillus sp. ISL-75]MBT2727543.1 S8 family serine peptidase [Bacillus sp. ISL-75]